MTSYHQRCLVTYLTVDGKVNHHGWLLIRVCVGGDLPPAVVKTGGIRWHSLLGLFFSTILRKPLSRWSTAISEERRQLFPPHLVSDPEHQDEWRAKKGGSVCSLKRTDGLVGAWCFCLACQWYHHKTGFHFKKTVTNVVKFLLSNFRHIRNCLSGKAASLYFHLFYWALTLEEEKELQSELSQDLFLINRIWRLWERWRLTCIENHNRNTSKRWSGLKRRDNLKVLQTLGRKLIRWDLVVKQNLFSASSKQWWLLYGEGQMGGGHDGRWAAVLNIREARALRKRALSRWGGGWEPPIFALFSSRSAFTYVEAPPLRTSLDAGHRCHLGCHLGPFAVNSLLAAGRLLSVEEVRIYITPAEGLEQNLLLSSQSHVCSTCQSLSQTSCARRSRLSDRVHWCVRVWRDLSPTCIWFSARWSGSVLIFMVLTR